MLAKFIILPVVCLQMPAQSVDPYGRIYHPYSMVNGVSKANPNKCYKLSKSGDRVDMTLVDCTTGKPIVEQPTGLDVMNHRVTRLEAAALNQSDSTKLISDIISTYRLSVEMLIEQSKELTRRIQSLENRLTALESSNVTPASMPVNTPDKLP